MVSSVILPFRIAFLEESAYPFLLVLRFHHEREEALLIQAPLIEGQARRRSNGRFRKPHGEGAPRRDSIGDFERPLLKARVREDFVHEAHTERLGRIDPIAWQRELQRGSEPDQPRKSLASPAAGGDSDVGRGRSECRAVRADQYVSGWGQL